jgi:amidohydrolase
LRRFEEIIQGVASAFGCQAEISVREITTAVINAPEITSRVQQAARQTMPQARLLTDYRSMGSEDMAYMMDTIPGCYFFVGSRNDELGFNAPHHNPHFDIDEQALPQAAGLMTAAAIEFLQPEA